MVRKGSRRIVVDGTVYCWRLRVRPTYFQGLAWSPCSFVVEHADTPGMALVGTIDQPHPSNWIGREAEPVLPSGVTGAVRLALREGWTPTAPGSASTWVTPLASHLRTDRIRGVVGARTSADDSQPQWWVRERLRRACASLHPHRPQPRCPCVSSTRASCDARTAITEP